MSFSGERKPSAFYFKWADRLSEKYLLYAPIAVTGGYVASSTIFAGLSGIQNFLQNGWIEFGQFYLTLSTLRQMWIDEVIKSNFPQFTFQWKYIQRVVDGILSANMLLVGIIYKLYKNYCVPIGDWTVLYFEACSLHFRNILAEVNRFKNDSRADRARLNMMKSLIGAIHFVGKQKLMLEVKSTLLETRGWLDVEIQHF